MSRHICYRVPPVAPALLEVDVTGNVEHLIYEALFNPDRAGAFYTPEESLTSHDEGMTGGVTLRAKGTSRTFLDGALAALKGDDRVSLTAFLAELDRLGAILITLEH